MHRTTVVTQVASEAALDSSRLGATRAVRQGRYTLHLDAASGIHRLYDLERDPGELEDLAPHEPERAAHLLAMLDDFAAGARAQSEPRALRQLAPGEREELRQLGYLEPSDSRSPGSVVHRP